LLLFLKEERKKMKPFRIDNDGKCIFTSSQIKDYGLPEEWGYFIYLVIEDDSHCLVADYKFLQSYHFRSIHRYSR
jgi:hypothetical protein